MEKQNRPPKKEITLKKPSMTLEIEKYTQQRKGILDFVATQLIDGIDYGFAYPGGDKKSLLKPGGEKFCGVLKLEPIFVPDLDIWSMLGSNSGQVVLICFLMTEERKQVALKKLKEMGKEFILDIYRNLAVAEGRGVGNTNELVSKAKNIKVKDNNLVKLIQKRALIDAVLRLAGLSELFTQDGEEQENQNDKQKVEKKKRGTKKDPKLKEYWNHAIDGLNKMLETELIAPERFDLEMKELKNLFNENDVNKMYEKYLELREMYTKQLDLKKIIIEAEKQKLAKKELKEQSAKTEDSEDEGEIFY